MLKRILGFTLLILPTIVFAKNTTVYSCDTCDSGKALNIARQKAPTLQCTWSNPPGTIPIPGDQICEGSSKQFIVANPITRQAYKFKVTSEAGHFNEMIVRSEYIALPNDEKSLLNTFYDIDAEFRANAAVTINSGFNQSINAKVPKNLSESFDFAQYANSAADDCENHPTNYFNPRKQKEVEDKMTRDIAKKIGSASWAEHWSNTDITGGGIQLGRDSLGLSVSFFHNAIGVFSHIIYGDSNNMLAFQVHYAGEYNVSGNRQLVLKFELIPQASYIDGINYGTLFTNNSNTIVDLSKIGASNCLIDFIIENGEVISGPTLPGGGQSPGSTPGGGTGGPSSGEICKVRYKSYGCSPWGCRVQVFVMNKPC
jgi:hypothetical protein